MDLHTDLAEFLAVPPWYKDANCKGSNQDDFFPERGSSTVIAKRFVANAKFVSYVLNMRLSVKNALVFGEVNQNESEELFVESVKRKENNECILRRCR